MEINVTRNDAELTVALAGRFDTTTAPQVAKELDGVLDGVERLVFDYKQLDYISSAGLRVMLTAMQVMEKQGETVVKNASPSIVEIFDITGLIDDLKIE